MTLERRFFLLGLGALAIARPALGQTMSAASKLITSARAQIGVTTLYDGSYRALGYPGGDVEKSLGVCTDVIVRAYRDAFDFDFQKAVHEDMRAAFSAYPPLWGLTRTDRNIDHRRVPNLETYLTRQHAKRALPDNLSDLAPGDLVTMRLPGNLPHIAIVSDKQDWLNRRYVIHNIGRGAREDVLDSALEKTLTARFVWLDSTLRMQQSANG